MEKKDFAGVSSMGINAVNPVLSSHLKKDQKLFFKADYSLTKI